jgi:DNA invertase Pin-like site-specific DNA recombinase
MERELTIERTRAGLEVARQLGRIGVTSRNRILRTLTIQEHYRQSTCT